MPLIAGLTLGGLGIGASIFGGMQQADASQNIAQSQLDYQRQTQGLALQGANYGIKTSQPTWAELTQMDSQMQNQQRTLQLQAAAAQRDQAILAQIDPAFVSAGQQAVAVMHGQSAPVLAPIQQQRQLQRNQLEQQLRQQMGSGYATSSAGLEALSQFDAQTSMVMSQNQQQYTQMLLGAAGSYAPNMTGNINQSASTLGQLYGGGLGSAGAIQNRQIGAYGQYIQGAIGTNPAQYGGAQFIGDQARGQMIGQLGGQFAGIGAGMVGQQMTLAQMRGMNGGGAMGGAGSGAPAGGGGGGSWGGTFNSMSPSQVYP